MADSPFKVIIVGGSITGLTLAHSLDRAGIDYVVLEKHPEIHPQIGASIGILPNGARILEQLGLFKTVEEMCQRFHYIHHCFPDGHYFRSSAPMMLETYRFVLPFSCLERAEFLEVMYTALKDKTRVRPGARVTSISSNKSGVSVYTEDGTAYHGDLVVGADGVHSVVRSEIWRIAHEEQPGLIPDSEKSRIRAVFSCVFGVSTPVPGMTHWDHVVRYNDRFCILIFPGIGGKIFWLVISKLDKTYFYPNIPRFTKDDAVARCEDIMDLPIWREIKFRDIWAKKKMFTMNPLEEYLMKVWHYGRMVCIGDSVSKMTPNMGQGANTAIESAASLSNKLRALILSKHFENAKPSEPEIHALLRQFNRERLSRLVDIHVSSWIVTRLETTDGFAFRFVGRYVAQFLGDFFAKGVARVVSSNVYLDYIPLTVRSGRDWPAVRVSESALVRRLAVLFVVLGMILVPLFAVCVAVAGVKNIVR